LSGKKDWEKQKPKSKKLFRRPPFRNIFMGKQAVVPGTGYIEIAITGTEFPDIRFTVDARAGYVTILLTIAGGEPTGTGHVAVTILVQQQGIEQFDNPLAVPIEVVSLRFLYTA